MRGMWLTAGVAAWCAGSALGQGFTARQIAADQYLTVVMDSPGDASKLYLAQLHGFVRVMDLPSGAVHAQPVLDVSANLDRRGDGGLLGLAFDPQFATNRWMYTYRNVLPDHTAVLSRWTVAADGLSVVAGSELVIYRAPRTIGHNAGWIGFGPHDGLLYVSSGDGGTAANPDPANASQTITGEWRGKILRIDLHGDDFPADTTRNYHVPASNPFVGTTGDDEIWAYGIRNAWRCSFDVATGELWMGDVGQDIAEEVDVDPAVGPGGKNYGWRCLEGTTCTGLNGCPCPTGIVPPVYAYGHGTGCSITGGPVYRGAQIPSLAGAYLFADWCTGHVFTLRRDGGGVVEDVTAGIQPAGGALANIAAFGADATGEVYLANLFSGAIYRLEPSGGAGCDPDTNQDGNVDQGDLDYLVNVIAGGANPGGIDPDFNRDGSADQGDIDALLDVIAGGMCP